MRKIIVNADDFGLCESVNQGIITSMTEGVVTSTTLMVNMPATMDAVKLVKKHKITNIGIHLNLTKGDPILPVNQIPLLYNEDKSKIDIRKIALTPEILHQIELELTAQIEKFLSFGLIPTHLDSHHHVHMLAGIDEIVFRLATEYNLPIRTHQPFLNRNIKMPLFVDCTFYNNTISMHHLKKILLTDADGAFEIMTHPGYLSEELSKVSIYNTLRFEELQILTSDDLKDFIKENNIELISFTNIK